MPPGCCPVVRLHADTALHDPVDLTVSFADFPLLIILFYITEGCLVRERTDRPGTERLTCAKNNFGIFMCLTLIITGEIQVDIRAPYFPLNPRKVSNGMSNPSFFSGVPHFGHTLSGISQPAIPANFFTSSESKSL